MFKHTILPSIHYQRVKVKVQVQAKELRHRVNTHRVNRGWCVVAQQI